MHAPYRDDCRLADQTIGIAGHFLVAPAGLPCEMRQAVVEADLERFVRDVVDVPLWGTGIFVLCEGVGIFHPQRILDILFAVDVAGTAFSIVQSPYVVQTASVVLVVVGQQDGVEVADTCAEHLRPEIRTGIDEYGHPIMLHQHAGTQSLVHRVSACAYFAPAAYHRYSLGCAAAEKRETRARCHILFFHHCQLFKVFYLIFGKVQGYSGRLILIRMRKRIESRILTGQDYL